MKRFIAPKRLLMGPGPSGMHPKTLEAMSMSPIGHLDPEFIHLMESIKKSLQYVFQTKNPTTLPISGPGSLGMESAFANLISHQDEILICINGVFGHRMKNMAKRMGAVVHTMSIPWGQPVDPNRVADILKEKQNISVVAFVHAETSTGVLSDAESISNVCQHYNCLSIMDSVTSLGGSPVFIDKWGIDVSYSGSQKCLSSTAGISPATFSNRALERIRSRNNPVQSWFMDIGEVMKYWQNGDKSYHHTAPIQSLYALHESLRQLMVEELEKAWERHDRNGKALIAGLNALGLASFVQKEIAIPQLIVVDAPDNELSIRQQLLTDFNIEIGGGLGQLSGKVWRIGNMGYSAQLENTFTLLNALSKIMKQPESIAIEAAKDAHSAV